MCSTIMLCNACDDMIQFLVFVTSRMLQPFPLKEISSRDFQGTKTRGVKQWKRKCVKHINFWEVHTTITIGPRITTKINKKL